MQQTIDAICLAATAPLSLIIVGVGQADFGAMEVLDGDTHPLQDSRGRKVGSLVVYLRLGREELTY
jgi:hypothetical protein